VIGEAPDTKSTEERAEAPFALRLYIRGNAATSNRAIVNLRKFCEAHLQGRYELEVVDVAQFPERAGSDQVIALPTLVRSRPLPMKRFIGDLSQTERLLAGMDVDFEPPTDQ
jgi:circadian clock protein KaiB